MTAAIYGFVLLSFQPCPVIMNDNMNVILILPTLNLFTWPRVIDFSVLGLKFPFVRVPDLSVPNFNVLGFRVLDPFLD